MNLSNPLTTPVFASYIPLITPVPLLIESPAGSPVAVYTIVRPSASVTQPAFIMMDGHHPMPGFPELSLTVISASAANAPPAIGAGSIFTVALTLALTADTPALLPVCAAKR